LGSGGNLKRSLCCGKPFSTLMTPILLFLFR
jgi:hypothetical protein